MKPLTIGLFGFGVVGEGIYRVLNGTPSLKATIKKICIKHPGKTRDAPAELFTTRYEDLLEDPEINVIIELIDDSVEAFTIVSAALKGQKAVVSANKKMIAEHLPELIRLQKEHQVSLLYEAAVCGSIPVIRNLEEYYDNDMLKSLSGIVNGSTNYILSKMAGGQDFDSALTEAQFNGFAESNPELDVSGRDAANKLVILLLHAYGIITAPGTLLFRGIRSLQESDAQVAREKGYIIKLIARVGKLSDGNIIACVLPQFITPDSDLFRIAGEFNGVIIESTLADKQFLSGKGAGRYPTSSAVLSDVAALRYDYRYEYRKRGQNKKAGITHDFYLKIYVSFDEPAGVPRDDFEWVEEFHNTRERQYIIGVIHFSTLAAAVWADESDVSIILMPDGVLEKEAMEQSHLQKSSLKPAGGM